MLKLKVISIIVLLVGASPGLSKSLTCAQPDFEVEGFNAIKKLVRDPGCEVRTVEDLLQRLPLKIKSNFVLFYRSLSLQGPHRVDYQNPRAILSNATSKNHNQKNIYLSFNGHPSQSGFNNIEILEVDPNSSPDQMFKYFDIEFSNHDENGNLSWEDIQKTIQISDSNPRSCTICHGSPARPIFPTYPNWPGAYNSRHMQTDPVEVEQLEKFKENSLAKKNARYQHLNWESSDNISGVSILQHSRSDSFNIHLNRANLKRAAKEIMADKDYKNYRSFLAAGMMQCSNLVEYIDPSNKLKLDQNVIKKFNLVSRYPLEVKNFIQKKFKNNKNQFGDGFERASNTPWQNWPALNLMWYDTLNSQGVDKGDQSVALIRYLFEGKGWNIQKWFLELKPGAYSMSDGTYWSSGLLTALLELDPELKWLQDMLYNESARQVMIKYSPNKENACRELKSESLKNAT